MTIWFTSDTHFGHAKVIQFNDRQFDSVEEMDEHLIERWNDCVQKRDRVFHLGDFAFKNHAKIFDRLNGDKHLILGNHDRKDTASLPWSSVRDNHSATFDSHPFFLHHYACRVWNRSHYGSYHLYGHSHGNLPGAGRSMDVGVDSIFNLLGDHRPISLGEVIGILEPIREFMKEPHR